MENTKAFSKKLYVTANDLLCDSYLLAQKIAIDSKTNGFKPTFMIALWRGGSLIGCAVQEFLKHVGMGTIPFQIKLSIRHGSYCSSNSALYWNR